MNAETQQQIYGGEISDYNTPYQKIDDKAVNHIGTAEYSDKQLESIYNTQVKEKGAVNVTSTFVNFDPRGLIDMRDEDPIQKAFKEKLNQLALDIGLTGDNSSEYNSNYTPSLRQQTTNDVQAARDLVSAALAELKELGAL